MDARKQAEPSSGNLISLDDIVLLPILSYFNKKDLALLGATCSDMRALTQDKSVNPFAYTNNLSEWQQSNFKQRQFAADIEIPRQFAADIEIPRQSIIAMLANNNLAISKRTDHSIMIMNLNLANPTSLVRKLNGHTNRIYDIVEFPNGLIASCSLDATIKLWDLSKPVGSECVKTLNILGQLNIPLLNVLIDDPIIRLLPLDNNTLIGVKFFGKIILFDLSDLALANPPLNIIGFNCSDKLVKLSNTTLVYSSSSGALFVLDIQKAKTEANYPPPILTQTRAAH